MENALSGKGKLLATWQVLAGGVSLGIVTLNFFQQGVTGVGVALTAVALLSLVAGGTLFRGTRVGSGLSWLTQLIQVPALYLQGFHFQFFLLFSADVGKDVSGDFFLRWHTGSGGILRAGEFPFQFAGVNLLAPLFCLLLLLGVYKKYPTERLRIP